jgi:hypothetical protein
MRALTSVRGFSGNELGLGHGRTHKSPASPRHARLAVNTAAAVAEFLLDTSDHRG